MTVLLALAIVALAGVQDSTVYEPGNGVSLPQVVSEVKAEYTPEAKQNRIEGKVVLEVVVLSDGKVGDVKIVESLDSVYGLDANAVKAMKQCVFKPGTKDGKPVAVRVHAVTNFTLR
jgi:periplasmic protein TonB